jgi:hypothetical protein
MKIGIGIQGRGEFLRLEVEGAKLAGSIRDDIRQLAGVYRARVIAELRRAKSGRQYGATTGRQVYRRTSRMATVFGGMQKKVSTVRLVTTNTRAYRASAPGEAPATLSGTLAGAVRAKISPPSKGLGATVYAGRRTAWYRHLLEFGTKQRTSVRSKRGKGGNRGSVQPRPIWGPLQDRLQAELFAKVEAAVAAAAGN